MYESTPQNQSQSPIPSEIQNAGAPAIPAEVVHMQAVQEERMRQAMLAAPSVEEQSQALRAAMQATPAPTLTAPPPAPPPLMVAPIPAAEVPAGLRDAFATSALEGLLHNHGSLGYDTLSDMAYGIANAMMVRRQKP